MINGEKFLAIILAIGGGGNSAEKYKTISWKATNCLDNRSSNEIKIHR